MAFAFKLNVSISSDPDRAPDRSLSFGNKESSLSDKLDQAINRALRQNANQQRSDESLNVQAAHFWERLKEEAKKAVDNINRDPEKIRLVGGRLEYEQIDDTTFLSEIAFQVKNVVIPCLILKVKYCDRFIAARLIYRYQERGEDREQEMSAEEFPFMIDKSNRLFLRIPPHTGEMIFDAETLCVQLFGKFWNPASRPWV
jgi:hypothetical protein